MLLTRLGIVNFLSGLVIAITGCGKNPTEPPQPPDPPADTTGPAISISNPNNGIAVGDTVTLVVSSSDSGDIEFVRFFLNDLLILGADDSTAPYTYRWTATGLAEGQALKFAAQAFDTSGNSRSPVASTVTYRWSSKPVVTSPISHTVSGDSISILAAATANINNIAYVEFLRNGSAVVGGRDSTAPYAYLWDASVVDTASASLWSIRAVDDDGNSAISVAVTIHYLWRQLLLDTDEAWDRDIATVSARSTPTQLHLRITTNGSWEDYRTQATGLTLAVFMDIDQNPGTGRTGFQDFPFTINDIGAEYRYVFGSPGDSLAAFDSLNYYGPDSSQWKVLRPLTNLDLIISSNSNALELRINRNEIGSPDVVDIVLANLFWTATTISWDFAPDQGSGHVSYTLDGSFSGNASPPSPVTHQLGASRVGTSTPAGSPFE